MGFKIAGSIRDYTQNMKLSVKWQMKKNNRTYTEKSNITANEFERYREQIEKIREDNRSGKTAIYQKLQNGEKLTAEEEAYLKEHDVMSYQEYKRLQAELENYEKELKECKTKEDVERLHTTRIGKSLSAVSMISNNPNIPKIKKMVLLMAENARIKAVAETTQKFKKSLQYQALPTDEEKRAEEEKRMEKLMGGPEMKSEEIFTGEKNEDGPHNALPEDGKNTDESSGFPESPEPPKTGYTGQDVMKLFQDSGNSQTFPEYGRQIYQKKLPFQPQEERYLKNKRG